MKNPLKNYMRKLLLEILEEPAITPLYGNVKKSKITSSDNNIYGVIENFKIDKYCLTIEFCDPHSPAQGTSKIESDSLASFRSEIIKYEPLCDYFKDCVLRVDYTHALGEQQSFDFLVSTSSKKIYESTELPKIFEPLVEWIDAHPELLV